MTKLPSKDAYVAIKTFLITGLIFSLVSFSCVYYNVVSVLSNLMTYGISLAIWLTYIKFAYKDPFEVQVIFFQTIIQNSFWHFIAGCNKGCNPSNDFHNRSICEIICTSTYSNFWGLHEHYVIFSFWGICCNSNNTAYTSDNILLCDKP